MENWLQWTLDFQFAVFCLVLFLARGSDNVSFLWTLWSLLVHVSAFYRMWSTYSRSSLICLCYGDGITGTVRGTIIMLIHSVLSTGKGLPIMWQTPQQSSSNFSRRVDNGLFKFLMRLLLGWGTADLIICIRGMRLCLCAAIATSIRYAQHRMRRS